MLQGTRSAPADQEISAIPDLRGNPDCWLPVYKWLTADRWSPAAPRLGRTHYGLGPVEPRPGCGPLTAFLTERHARIWGLGMLPPGEYVLWRGQAALDPGRWIWVPGWQRVDRWPTGTVACRRILLTRWVDTLTVAPDEVVRGD